jgi:ABC-type antimicrobial peptide transport system permease subunit
MSNNNQTTNVSGGIGFAGLLAIVFIVLKLLDKIDWSWWWVLSPLWIPLALVTSILLIVGFVGLIVIAVKAARRSKPARR